MTRRRRHTVDDWRQVLNLRRRGAQWEGPCPLCGGTKRFHVTPRGGRALVGCRGCIDGFGPETRRQNYLEIVRLVFGEPDGKRLSVAEEVAQADVHARRAQEAREREEDRARRAAEQAEDMLRTADYDTHPYLERKGFPDTPMLVLEGQLLVPMRNPHGRLVSVQTIDPDGTKKFIPGSKVRGASYAMGRSRRGERVLVEGLATGLSVEAAMKYLYRDACVVVVFSAANFKPVARRRDLVVADHDWWRCRNKHRWDHEGDCPECGAPGTAPAGEAAALATGCTWWMPPNPGTDANDFHQATTTADLAQALRHVFYKAPPGSQAHAAARATEGGGVSTPTGP